MPTPTDNHGYDVYSVGEESPWSHGPTIESLDTDVEIRDVESNLPNYTPKNNAKFIATDTNAVYLGNGTNWNVVTFKPTADHIADTSNPHSVTAAQVSAPTQTEFDTHTSDTSNPHGVTAAQADAPTTTTFNNHTGDAAAHHPRPVAGTLLSEDASNNFNVDIATDTATASGDGTATTFTLGHSLGVAPTVAHVQATSADASGAFHVSNKTTTTIDVTFASAPVTGTDNLTFDIITA